CYHYAGSPSLTLSSPNFFESKTMRYPRSLRLRQPMSSLSVSKQRRLFFSRKFLTRSLLILYTTAFARRRFAHCEEETSMMTSRTYKEHTAKWSTRVEMRAVCLAGGLSLLSVNYFGARLGQETAIDSQNIRH